MTEIPVDGEGKKGGREGRKEEGDGHCCKFVRGIDIVMEERERERWKDTKCQDDNAAAVRRGVKEREDTCY